MRVTIGVGAGVRVGMEVGTVVLKVHLQKPEADAIPSEASQSDIPIVSAHQLIPEPLGHIPDQLQLLLMHPAPIAAHLFAQVSLPVMQVVDVGT